MRQGWNILGHALRMGIRLLNVHVGLVSCFVESNYVGIVPWGNDL